MIQTKTLMCDMSNNKMMERNRALEVVRQNELVNLLPSLPFDKLKKICCFQIVGLELVKYEETSFSVNFQEKSEEEI